MIENHINRTLLRKKISELFHYRLLPSLFEYGKNNEKEFIGSLKEKLFALQEAIYFLDAHLEAHWDLNEETMAWHWQNIIQSLQIINNNPTDFHHYLSNIKKYEKHERNLRVGKLPTSLNMRYFYYYKSCDVKLIRRLIYEQCSIPLKRFPLALWTAFDLITEVNDDVEDLLEDMDFINGNRFLISLIVHGKNKTKNDFITFIDAIIKESIGYHKLLTVRSTSFDLIHHTTVQHCNTTKQLLIEAIEKIHENDVYSAKIAPYLVDC